MIEFENTRYFSALNMQESKELHVFTDGSFDNGATYFYRRHPMGAGWAIANEYDKFIGYGVSSFKTRTSLASEMLELQAMLEFLDALYTDFPHVVNRDRKVIMHSDNQSLIVLLKQAKHSKKASRLMMTKFRDEYVRMAYYMAVMNLDFKWVKGHASNRYNRLADNIARKAYRSRLLDGSFDGEFRRRYLKEALQNFHVSLGSRINTGKIKQILISGQSHLLKEFPALDIKVKTVAHEGRTVAHFSYQSSRGDSDERHAVFLKNQSPLYLALRAARYSLQDYLVNGIDKKTLIIKMHSSEAVSIINALVNKQDVTNRSKNARIRHEVSLLAELVQGKNLVAISELSMMQSKRQRSQNKGNVKQRKAA